MPAAKGCRVSRRVAGDKADVMSNRQEKNNLSELQVNWIGKCHLNAGESDLMYKYHVVSKNLVMSQAPLKIAGIDTEYRNRYIRTIGIHL